VSGLNNDSIDQPLLKSKVFLTYVPSRIYLLDFRLLTVPNCTFCMRNSIVEMINPDLSYGYSSHPRLIVVLILF
jgi:hypothetical protein